MCMQACVLDFMYLGPSLTARSKSFVKTSEAWKFYPSVPLGTVGALQLYNITLIWHQTF